MTFPSQQLTVIDPGLGVSTPVANTPVISGKAFGGSASPNVVYSIGSLSDVRSILGYGPLAEDVALTLQQRGSPVFAVVHSDSSAPVTGVALTKSGTGPAITVSGLARDNYALLLQVVAGGALGVGTFRYALDAFSTSDAPATWSQTRIIPSGGTFVIPNSGLTLTFPSGTYIAGDSYTYNALAPEVGTVDLGSVSTMLQGRTDLVFYLWGVSGAFATATAGATVAAALGGALDALTQTFRYARGFVDIGSGDTEANAITQSASWVSSRVQPDYGYELIQSALPFEGFTYRKASCASGIMVRGFRELISTDLSRVASGPISGVQKIYFDENTDQQLDTLKIGGMRIWSGIPGYFCANAPLKSTFGSDFTDLQFGRVMDVACRTTFEGQFPYTSESLRTISTGAIDPRDAAQIEGTVNGQLNNALLAPNNARGNPGHVSAVAYHVDLNWNLNTTNIVKSSVGIRPLGYSKMFVTTLAFTLNP